MPKKRDRKIRGGVMGGIPQKREEASLPIEPFAVRLNLLKDVQNISSVQYVNAQPVKSEPHLDHMRGTPFLDSVWRGMEDEVQSMLDQGSPVDEADRFGHTALIVASYRGHEYVVQMLLDAGAKVDATTGDGWSGLHYAVQASHIPVCHVLLDAGSNPDFRDINYWTPLHHAAHLGHGDIVHHLLSRGADYDALTSGSASALVLAAADNFRECALMIVAAGGKCYREYLGKSPHYLASTFGWVDDLQRFSRPPGPPGVPVAHEVRARSLQIRWAEPVEYSAPVDAYKVEIRLGAGQLPVPLDQVEFERKNDPTGVRHMCVCVGVCVGVITAL